MSVRLTQWVSRKATPNPTVGGEPTVLLHSSKYNFFDKYHSSLFSDLCCIPTSTIFLDKYHSSLYSDLRCIPKSTIFDKYHSSLFQISGSTKYLTNIILGCFTSSLHSSTIYFAKFPFHLFSEILLHTNKYRILCQIFCQLFLEIPLLSIKCRYILFLKQRPHCSHYFEDEA